jgi:hypothetical protein
MHVSVFAGVVASVSILIIITGIAALMYQRKITVVLALFFATLLGGAYWMAKGVRESMDAAMIVMDAGSVVAEALHKIDNDKQSNCSVPMSFITSAEGYTHRARTRVETLELSAQWAIFTFYGSFVASVMSTALCGACCCRGNSSAVLSMSLAAISAVVVAAGSSASCAAYVDKSSMSSDVLYLVDVDAPPPDHKLLPLRHIEVLRNTCDDAALVPLDQFTKAGAFEPAYKTVNTGLCADTRNGAICVAVIAWLSLLALVINPGAAPAKSDANAET